MTLPLRLMILHFSHMGLTDGLTFMLINLLYLPEWPLRRRKLRITRFRLRRKLVHYAAPPLPTRPASLGSRGGPFRGKALKGVAYDFEGRLYLLTWISR